mgnify:CR=1 FL=1
METLPRLSPAAAKQLEMIEGGEARVRLELINDTPDQMVIMEPMKPIEMTPTTPAAASNTLSQDGFLGEPTALAMATPAAEPAPVKTPAAKPATDTAAWTAAYPKVTARDWPGVESAMSQFIADWPKSIRVPQAKYWLGRSFAARTQYPQAAKAFLDVYQSAPRSIPA